MATSALGFQNKFTTTLSAGISASDTTIGLTNLPTPSEGYLVIEPDSSTAWEEIYYTSKTGSAVVCPSVGAGRGQGGSSAASHSSGATVRMDSTAEMFESLQDGTGLANSIITNAKLSTTAGEIGGAWTDYSATSTIVGWTSFTVKQIFYKQIGKTVFVSVYLAGTSNATNITFTLPLPASTHLNNWEGLPGLIIDNGTAVGPGRWNIVPGTNPSLVNVFINSAGGGFNSSGTKEVRIANIIYETT